jgi:hypothetical protein
MTTDNKEDFIDPLETNVENNVMVEGLNNENNAEVMMRGGDDEVGLPSIQEKKPEKKEGDNKPDNEEIDSPKPEIKNPDTETIIKKIEGEQHVGDKLDIDVPKFTSLDSSTTPPTDEYVEN